jgi:hypothetical protein
VLAVFALRSPAVPEGMTPETQAMVPTEEIPLTQNVGNTAPTGTTGEAKPDVGHGETAEFPLQLARESCGWKVCSSLRESIPTEKTRKAAQLRR